MKRVFLLLVIALLSFGCEKDNDPIFEREQQKEVVVVEKPAPVNYLLLVTNESTNPYRFRLYQGSSVVKEITLAGKEKMRFYYKEGSVFRWEALQLSGYLLYPSERSGSVVLNEDKFIYFP